MKSTLERELKLAPPHGLDLSGLDGERIATRTFESRYHDTADRALLRRGVTLRRRVEHDAAVWQLKLPTSDGRFELEFETPAEEPPVEAAGLVLALTRRRPLEPVASLRTTRETVRVRNGDVDVADVVLDLVSVVEGDRIVAAFDELEIELIDGENDDLRRLERVLRDAGAEDSPGPTKLSRALGIVEANGPAPPGNAPAEALVAALGAQLEQILARDPGTRAGIDDEDLHQFRVATRRLRAFLRSGRVLLDYDWAETTRAELGWLGGLLGGVRDLDVLLAHLRAEAALLEPDEQAGLEPLFAALEQDRVTARAALVVGISSDRYFELLERLESQPPTSGDETPLRDLWRADHHRARKAVAALDDDPPDHELHVIRIRVKRARYAAELLGKPGRAYVEAAKEFQDVLGAHQDAVVAEDMLRSHVAALPEAGLGAGRLIERERARRTAARAAWRDAWDRLEKRAKKVGR